MAERFATPTPRDLSVRKRRPEALERPEPAAESAPAPTAGRTWDREAYETGIRFSDLHPNARLCAFLLAHFADPHTGVIASERVPELRSLARAAGINEVKVRYSLAGLTHRQWMARAPYDSDRQLHGAITLTIPAGQPQPRAR